MSRRKYHAAWYQENKEHVREAVRSWRASNPDAVSRITRRAILKRRYGLTPEQVDAMALDQGNRCLICEEQAPLCVDHDHESGRIRGLLCRHCNLAIGILADDPERIGRALRYLTAARELPS